MANPITTHKILLLSSGLVLLAMINVWLFVPHFLSTKQLLDSSELRQDQSQLVQLSKQAADYTAGLARKPQSQATVVSYLEPVQSQIDEIVLELQATSHDVSLDKEVKDTLQLAQVLSFTLRDYTTQNTSDSLNNVRISQVLAQASTNAGLLHTMTTANPTD